MPRNIGRGGVAKASRLPGGRGENRGSSKIGGLDIKFDPSLGHDQPQPTPTFPLYKPVQPQPLTSREKKQVTHFLTIRKSFNDGPYYTILGNGGRVGKPGSRAAASFDPFDGTPKYSQKYTKKPRKLPNLACRTYELKYFPKELHSTLDPSINLTNGDGTHAQAKRPFVAKARRINGADAAESKITVEGDEEDGPPKEANPDDDDAAEGEEVDDDFDEDDDEGGDYNAEGYFDDGGDDIGEDMEGGDGDGGDYF